MILCNMLLHVHCPNPGKADQICTLLHCFIDYRHKAYQVLLLVRLKSKDLTISAATGLESY